MVIGGKDITETTREAGGKDITETTREAGGKDIAETTMETRGKDIAETTMVTKTERRITVVTESCGPVLVVTEKSAGHVWTAGKGRGGGTCNFMKDSSFLIN